MHTVLFGLAPGRAKHAAHVVSTNFAVFGLGFIGFFLAAFVDLGELRSGFPAFGRPD